MDEPTRRADALWSRAQYLRRRLEVSVPVLISAGDSYRALLADVESAATEAGIADLDWEDLLRLWGLQDLDHATSLLVALNRSLAQYLDS